MQRVQFSKAISGVPTALQADVREVTGRAREQGLARFEDTADDGLTRLDSTPHPVPERPDWPDDVLRHADFSLWSADSLHDVPTAPAAMPTPQSGRGAFHQLRKTSRHDTTAPATL